MATMKLGDSPAMYVGSRSVTRVMLGGAQVWPLNFEYVIDASTAVMHYSAGKSFILADGSNYAYVTADVDVYQSGTYKYTLQAQTLTPITLSGTYANRFYIEGASVMGYDRDTTEANVGTAANPRGYYCTATRFQYANVYANITGLTFQQQYNIIEDDSQYEDNYNAYEATLNTQAISATGGTATVASCQAGYERVTTLVWTSGSESYRTQQVWFTKNPTAISVDPDSGVTVNLSQKKITFPANATTADIPYEVTISYTEGGRTLSSVCDIVVRAAGIDYETPVITVTYPLVSGENYHIPATGGTVYPTVTFSQRWKYSTDTSYTNSRKMTGTITGGAQRGTASDGTRDVTFTMNYSGANVNYGGVNAPNRGTNEYTESVYAEVETTAIGGGGLESNYIISSIKQQANVVTATEEVSVSYYIKDFKVVFSRGGRYSTSAADEGTISYSECGKKYKVKSTWTTNQKSTSLDWSYEPIVPTYETDLTGATIDGSTIETTKRNKNESTTRSGSVTASFGTSTSSYAIYQDGTQKTYSLTSDYADGLYLHAYEETVAPDFTAYINYDNGDDPDTDDNPSVRRSSNSSSGVPGRITYSGLTISSVGLGTREYTKEATAKFIYEWTSHSTAKTEIVATQEHNIIEDTSWATDPGEKEYDYDAAYQEYDSWQFSASADKYTSSRSAAPNGHDGDAITATLTVTAKHRERTATPWSRTEILTPTYTWTSGDPSTGEPEEGQTTTGIDYLSNNGGNWAYFSDIPICSTRVSYSWPQSGWISIDELSEGNTTGVATAEVEINENGNDARDALIIVSRPRYAGQAEASISIHIYQKAGNLAISVSPSSISTEYAGGIYNIVVTATSTSWALTYSNDTPSYPVFRANSDFSPRSGNAGDTTVRVTVPERPVNPSGANPRRYATIYITSTEDSNIQATVDVMMERPIIEE